MIQENIMQLSRVRAIDVWDGGSRKDGAIQLSRES